MSTILNLGEFYFVELLSFIDILYLIVFMLSAEYLKGPLTDWLSYLMYGKSRYMEGKRVSKHWVVAWIGALAALPFIFIPGLQAIGTQPVVLVDNQIVKAEPGAVELYRYGHDIYKLKLIITWAFATKFYDTIWALLANLWNGVRTRLFGSKN